MNEPTRQFTQRGMTSIIVAVLMLIVIGIALAVALQSAGSNFSDVSSQSDTADALYLAESAVERGLYRASANIPCSNLAPDPATGGTTFGRGTFAILTAAAQPNAQCDIDVLGIVGLSQRKLRARIQYNPGMPLDEPFPSLADFTTHWSNEVLISNNGFTGFDGTQNCPNPPCVNTVAGTGAFIANTNLNNPGATLEGYRERTLAIPFSTGTTATGINFSIGYTKGSSSGNPVLANIAIDLVDSSQGFTDRIWSDVATGNIAWTYVNALAVTLPINRTYDKIHIYVNLAERPQGMAKRQVFVLVDDIRITRIGATAKLVRWSEVIP